MTLELGGHRQETFLRADLIVVSPGVKLDQPVLIAARDAGIPVMGELELASRWLRGRVIAVTGTKGKSTTTTLTGRMLEQSGFRVRVGGNIGVPLSAQVDDSTTDTLHVVEASSFQLQTTDTFHPWIAALLNFSPDHLDQHASIEEYAAAKARDLPAAERLRLGGGERRRRAGRARWPQRAAARRVRYGLSIAGDGFTVADGVIVERRVGDRDAAGAGRCGAGAGPPHSRATWWRQRRSAGPPAPRRTRCGPRCRRSPASSTRWKWSTPSRACGS